MADMFLFYEDFLLPELANKITSYQLSMNLSLNPGKCSMDYGQWVDHLLNKDQS